MNPFEMVVIIVVISLLAGIAKQWINSRQTPEVDLSPMENKISKLESLEERVRILEAIVTDKGYDLKKEIDNL